MHNILKKKIMKLNSQSAQYEKNKIDEDSFKKKIIKKTMWGNIVAIYSILKKKNYKTEFLTNFILKK
jgi:hypothetical protein